MNLSRKEAVLGNTNEKNTKNRKYREKLSMTVKPCKKDILHCV